MEVVTQILPQSSRTQHTFYCFFFPWEPAEVEVPISKVSNQLDSLHWYYLPKGRCGLYCKISISVAQTKVGSTKGKEILIWCLHGINCLWGQTLVQVTLMFPQCKELSRNPLSPDLKHSSVYPATNLELVLTEN